MHDRDGIVDGLDIAAERQGAVARMKKALEEKKLLPGGENPKDAFGRAKPGLSSIPPVALVHLGKAMDEGRRKYGHMNWRSTRVNAIVYYDAMMRHLLKWFDREDDDKESGLSHLAHVMAGAAILLDAEASGTLVDDRPVMGGRVSELIDAMTVEVEKKEKTDE